MGKLNFISEWAIFITFLAGYILFMIGMVFDKRSAEKHGKKERFVTNKEVFKFLITMQIVAFVWGTILNTVFWLGKLLVEEKMPQLVFSLAFEVPKSFSDLLLYLLAVIFKVFNFEMTEQSITSVMILHNYLNSNLVDAFLATFVSLKLIDYFSYSVSWFTNLNKKEDRLEATKHDSVTLNLFFRFSMIFSLLHMIFTGFKYVALPNKSLESYQDVGFVVITMLVIQVIFFIKYFKNNRIKK